MNRNILILIISIIVLILMIVIIRNNNKTTLDNELVIRDEDIKYDEETNLYYIVDEETGEIINASEDANSFDLYKIDPDYNPNPLLERKANLEDYIQYEEPIIEEGESLEILR